MNTNKIERQLQGSLNTVFTKVIEERNLSDKLIPYTVAEEGRADITLKTAKGKSLFFVELKDPTAKDGKTVFDSGIILREMERAQRMDVNYFGICNFTATTLIDRNKIYDRMAISEGFFNLHEINRLRVNYIVNNDIEKKLKNIANFYIDRAIEIISKKPVSFTPVDEIFIFKIRKLIEVYAYTISDNVWEKYQNDKAFAKRISEYAKIQQWQKPQTYQEIENLTHISLLMLISKLVFYKAYYDNNVYKLPKLNFDNEINTSEKLKNTLWEYFEEFKEITKDFELLIGEKSDIIFELPFVSENTIELVNDVLKAEETYNFGNTPYDIIGRIFEELINEDERHKLGQYFTPPIVIDLINSFCIKKGNEKVLDPSCGSGTFLVRAYERKKSLLKKMHTAILSEIYGSDISNYAAYLALLNLSIRDMKRPSYPQIIHKDFFSLHHTTKVDFFDNFGNKEKRCLPMFDSIIGNPPYTRQEDINAFNDKTKGNIANLIYGEWKLKPSKRTSIYGYFFYHSASYLKEGGYLGFIVSNSWLNVDYGQDMQRWMLAHFEIVSIIDSSVERFFPSADVNTCIVILKRQSNEEIRTNNVVKFVYLTEKLDTVNKFAGKIKVSENPTILNDTDKFRLFIETVNQNTENEYFKINCIKQNFLHSTPEKWSAFIKAPQIYWNIITKNPSVFVKLKEVVNVKFGIKTGCNEYFYFKDKTNECKKKPELLKTAMNNIGKLEEYNDIIDKELMLLENGVGEYWLIEEQFVRPIIISAREIKHYSIEKGYLENYVLTVNLVENYEIENEDGTYGKRKKYDIKQYRKEIEKDYPYLAKYIKYGEKTAFKNEIVSEKRTCAGRPAWWDLNKTGISRFAYPYMIGTIHKIPLNQTALLDHNLIDFYCKKENINYLGGILNSYIFRLFIEMTGREMTGALTVKKVEVYELNDVIIPYKDVNKEVVERIFEKLKTKPAKSIFDELNAKTTDELDLTKVEPLRYKLDNAVLKIIGFTNETERNQVQTELYKNLITIISSRLSKSDSVKSITVKRQKTELSVYIEELKKIVEEFEIKVKNTPTFASKIKKLVIEITSEKSLQKKIISSYWKEKFNETFDIKELQNKEQGKLF